jgi:high-affinity Fe2+/Pb2+ permease
VTSPDRHHLSLTRPAHLGGFALVGVVAGWLIRRVDLLDGEAPSRLGWAQPGALVIVGALLLVAARAMRKARTDVSRRLPPRQAVNRLVTAKACALGGAALTGAYLGYALAWLGSGSEVAASEMLRGALTALAAAFLCAGGLILERACRTGHEDS